MPPCCFLPVCYASATPSYSPPFRPRHARCHARRFPRITLMAHARELRHARRVIRWPQCWLASQYRLRYMPRVVFLFRLFFSPPSPHRYHTRACYAAQPERQNASRTFTVNGHYSFPRNIASRVCRPPASSRTPTGLPAHSVTDSLFMNEAHVPKRTLRRGGN